MTWAQSPLKGSITGFSAPLPFLLKQNPAKTEQSRLVLPHTARWACCATVRFGHQLCNEAKLYHLLHNLQGVVFGDVVANEIKQTHLGLCFPWIAALPTVGTWLRSTPAPAPTAGNPLRGAQPIWKESPRH